jgi:hypothetical protein
MSLRVRKLGVMEIQSHEAVSDVHSFFYENKCGHRNVLSKRQVWMSIFHIINFKKKKFHEHMGPGFF